jgi:hypothetical protein
LFVFTNKFQASGEGGVLNIVPVVFVECNNLQLAIDRSYQFLVEAIARFEVAAAEFLADEKNPLGFSVKDKETLVRAFRASWAGHFLWWSVNFILFLLSRNSVKKRKQLLTPMTVFLPRDIR